MRVGRKRIPFPCHLKSRTCFAFLPPHLSSSLFTSSPFPPITPALPSSLSGFWSICDPYVHRRRPTSCVWASSLPSLLAVHVRVWEYYGLYISTQSWATCTRVIAAKLVCIALRVFPKTGHPRGNTSVSWPGRGNGPKQDVAQSVFNHDQTLERHILHGTAEQTSYFQ